VRFTQFQDATALLVGDALDGPVTVQNALPGDRPLQARLRVGLATHLRQTWQLQRVEVGDLVSHQSLAPGETIELTVERTERRSLEQTREDMTQLDQSTESGSTDRESLNVAQTAARSNQWNVNGNLNFSIPGTELLGFGGNISAGYASQSSDTLVTTSEHAHEQTRKAASALRTQSKLTVKVSSEITNRTVSRRTVANPSSEQTLQIWGYELVKRFRVVTAPDRVQAAVAIQVQPLEFDSAFLAANAGFVRGALFDTDLLESLDDAVAAARKFGSLGGAGKPVDEAELDLLEAMVLGKAIDGGEYWINGADIKPAELVKVSSLVAFKEYNDWVAAGVGPVLLKWSAVYQLAQLSQAGKMAFARASSPFTAAETAAGLTWLANRGGLLRELADTVRKELDPAKVAGLLEMTYKYTTGSTLARLLVQFAWLADTLLGPSPNSEFEFASATEDRGSMQAVLDHLNAYASHYSARYLEWIERTTGRAAFARLATAMLEQNPDVDAVKADNPFAQFRVDDLRIVGSDLIVPILTSPFVHSGWTKEVDKLTQALIQSVLAADGLAADLAAVHTAVDAALCSKVAEPKDVAEGAWQGDMAKVLQDAQAKDPTMGPALGDQQGEKAKGGTANGISLLGGYKAPPAAPPKGPPQPISTPAAPLLKPEFYVHVDDDVRTLVDGLHLVAGFV
jgi:hypothetical protein